MDGSLEQSDGTFSVADLVKMFEDAEDASIDARKNAERDRDYYDNNQFTAEEIATLNKRKQPIVMDNRIKTKVDFLVGLEKQQGVGPKALPRTPMHEEEAEAVSQALKYVADVEDYDSKRSDVWKNLLIEGAGGISVAVEQGYDGEPQIVLRRWAWDRMFADPHSSELDYSDAGYLGGVIWQNYDDAIAMYGEGAKEALETTLASVHASDTYDDKPKFRLWADPKNKRVRIVQIWVKKADKWYFAEFTKGGILKAGESPYVTDKGESDCELVFQSAYVNRDNDRYGLVREMVSLQDAINKRQSKALHLLNATQITALKGAVDDVEKARREAARPDMFLEVNPVGGQGMDQNIKIENRVDLATAHFQLLQEHKNSIDLKGPNATMLGDKAQGSASASGRAIMASQQGGMIQLGDLLDHMRHLDVRVFRKIWYRIRQFWTAEKWVRVTDDEKNIRWLGVNVDPMQAQMLEQQNPDMIAGSIANIAELDCDIIVESVPDSMTPALEQFQALVELKQFDVNQEIPFRALIEAAPNLRSRSKILEMMDKRAEEQAQSPQGQLQMRGMEAEVSEKEQSAVLKNAQAQKALADANVAPIAALGLGDGQPQPQEYELPPELQNAQAIAEIEDKQAGANQKNAAAYKLTREAELAPQKMMLEAKDRAEDRKVKARQANRPRAA